MAHSSITTAAAAPESRQPAWILSDRRAWYVWLAFACCIAAVVANAPGYRTVSNNYREACLNWFAERPLYADGKHGFLYFPHAAILFAPFAYLPFTLGEILWRAMSIGALAWATWRWSRLLVAARLSAGIARGSVLPAEAMFGLLTMITLPPAIASARNGQMNLMLTTLTALAFAEIAESRWRAATLWLALGAAMKPLALVPIAVSCFCYRPLLLPIVLAAAALFVLPFFTEAPDYVWQEYQTCLNKLLLAGNPGDENPGSDLFGLLSAVDCSMPVDVQSAIRALAGAITLALSWFALRSRQPIDGARAVLAFTTCYLALFNPRMENNGFVIIAPALACLASEAFSNRSQWFAGTLLVLASIGIAASYEITRGPNFWLSPLLTILVMGYAVFDAAACCLPAKLSKSRGGAGTIG